MRGGDDACLDTLRARQTVLKSRHAVLSLRYADEDQAPELPPGV